MRKNPDFYEDFARKSGFQDHLTVGFSGIAKLEKQKGTPLEKGALA
jgi:hypothetical protein